ncbi:MAG: sodium/proton-translocating pyrophosphatase, partial [Candidatus Saccharibacteria bacterium]
MDFSTMNWLSAASGLMALLMVTGLAWYIFRQERTIKTMLTSLFSFAMMLLTPAIAFASEADLKIPELSGDERTLLIYGIGICVLGFVFGLYQFTAVKKLPAHQAMLDVAATIYETCKTYLLQQGKFLIILFVFIGLCVAFYFGYLQKMAVGNVLMILGFTILGILGSYGVAWYGIRMNTLANSRTAFSGLETKPLKTLNIALDAGMSIGVL